MSGWLTVKAPFSLEIREEGRLIGTTDADRLMLAAGRHDIELVNETLGYRVTRVVQVMPGKVASLAVDLPKGVVHLNATPWAEVWIDGQRVGETPIGNLSMPIGPHESGVPASAVRREAPRDLGDDVGADAGQRRHEIGSAFAIRTVHEGSRLQVRRRLDFRRGCGADVLDGSDDGDGDDTGDGVGECGAAGGASPARAAGRSTSSDKVVAMATHDT